MSIDLSFGKYNSRNSFIHVSLMICSDFALGDLCFALRSSECFGYALLGGGECPLNIGSLLEGLYRVWLYGCFTCLLVLARNCQASRLFLR